MKKQVEIKKFNGNNKEEVLRAVSENAQVFCQPDKFFISSDLRNDKDVIIAALNAKEKSSSSVLKHAGLAIKEDRELALMCVKANPLAIRYVSEKLTADDSFIRDAIVANPKLLSFPLQQYELDKDLFARIYNENFEGLKYLKATQILKGMQELGFNVSEILAMNIDSSNIEKLGIMSNRIKYRLQNAKIITVNDLYEALKGNMHGETQDKNLLLMKKLLILCFSSQEKQVEQTIIVEKTIVKEEVFEKQSEIENGLDQKIAFFKSQNEELEKANERKKEILQKLNDRKQEIIDLENKKQALEAESKQLDEEISALFDLLDQPEFSENEIKTR